MGSIWYCAYPMGDARRPQKSGISGPISVLSRLSYGPQVKGRSSGDHLLIDRYHLDVRSGSVAVKYCVSVGSSHRESLAISGFLNGLISSKTLFRPGRKRSITPCTLWTDIKSSLSKDLRGVRRVYDDFVAKN